MPQSCVSCPGPVRIINNTVLDRGEPHDDRPSPETTVLSLLYVAFPSHSRTDLEHARVRACPGVDWFLFLICFCVSNSEVEWNLLMRASSFFRSQVKVFDCVDLCSACY